MQTDQTEANAASKRKGVQWDEPTIAEHDKERGTRKKIAEPKTPFRPTNRDFLSSAGSVGSVASDDSMNTGEHMLKLNDPRLAAAFAINNSWDSGSETESHISTYL